ncbi:MAG: alpha-L-fucosidase [Planctomycetota bacterium]|nr:alpha-L-fucosidase [Planctomycetota bacterium]
MSSEMGRTSSPAMTREERLQWWNEARFGMFIHWGLYASLAGEWKGEKIRGIGEWIMYKAKIPIPEYESLAKGFNPVTFDAEAWAEVARQAGMKYVVITAKHHDGFCMFDSSSNPYNIVKQTPFKRDPMKELAAACNKRGIKMCFYYSQAQDWHAPGGAGHWDEIGPLGTHRSYTRPPEDFQKYLDAVVKPNLTELLTNYGPIGLIWFDTPVAITPEQSRSLCDLVHHHQPACLVSGRVGHDVGDYGSLGDNVHPVGKVKGAWETPATLNDTWGFKADDHNWKSLDCLLELLVNCASKGVNYLLNVGPTAEGVIPQPSVELLKQIGAWLERNGEAVYGTVASPFLVDPGWGRVTCKGETLYLLIKQWPAGELKLYGLRNKVRSARVIGVPEAKVGMRQEGDLLALSLPVKAPEKLFSVVAVTVDGVPEAEQLIIQDGAAALYLPLVLGEIEGKVTVSQERGTERWKDMGNRASWRIRINTPGEYEVVVVTRANKNHPEWFGNHDVQVSIDGAHVTGTVGVRDLVPSPDDGAIFQCPRSRVGRIRIDNAGDHTLRVQAVRMDPTAERGLTLVAIELTLATEKT